MLQTVFELFRILRNLFRLLLNIEQTLVQKAIFVFRNIICFRDYFQIYGALFVCGDYLIIRVS